jgi:ectoine hydroxylase-related dioxygenase (phytanoyl-CoA dioxygenase family)
MTLKADLSAPYSLGAGEGDAYRRDGHILLRGVASPGVVAHFRPLITGLVDRVAGAEDRQQRLDNYGAMFTQVTNVWRMDDEVRDFIFAGRFAGIAAQLMGVEGVRLYHDQALVKEPGGKRTPWHQDYFYWPLATHNSITMWLALVDIPPEMGSMSFATGSHRNPSFPRIPISEESQRTFEQIIRTQHIPTPGYSLKAGDATFHAGEVLHCAHPNSSRDRREVITVIYYEDGTRILEPDSEHRRVDLEVFHPGLRPGDLAASPLNPLLYPSSSR